MTEEQHKPRRRGAPPALSQQTDFYRAWEMVNSAESYTATVRARAFAIWVALFGSTDSGGFVTINSSRVSEEFSVSRASWLQYREVLAEVGLIEEVPVKIGRQRKAVRLIPPLHSV
jgi:hypothetical protein